ncbi:hypothetical protein ER45_029115 (plasmid) [Bacillus mycoides]|nr:hypothetical protein ER45_029115 [Bacillus mycoides]
MEQAVLFLPASKTYADQVSHIDKFIKNDTEGLYVKNIDGFYFPGALNDVVKWSTHDLFWKDAEIAPFFLIDDSKIDTIIQEVKNQKDMELTDLLEILTVHAPSQEMLLLSNTFENPTNATIKGTSGNISRQFTSTISANETNATTLGMKQTMKAGIDFFNIVKDEFSMEWNESYTYTNAHQTLTLEATTLTSGAMTVDVKPGEKYLIDTVMRRIKENGRFCCKVEKQQEDYRLGI